MGEYPFQRATVEAICAHFRRGNTRAVCADEAGLGKTFVARGVIARLAEERLTETLPAWRAWWNGWAGRLDRPWAAFLRARREMPGSGARYLDRRVKEFAARVCEDLDVTPLVPVPRTPAPDQRGACQALEQVRALIEDRGDDALRAVVRRLAALSIGMSGGGRRFPDWDIPLEGVPRPLRVLYVSTSLAVAEQNAGRLTDIPQRSRLSGMDRADRLSVLWYFLEKFPTPWVEVYPVTAAVMKGDTPGTQAERRHLLEDPDWRAALPELDRLWRESSPRGRENFWRAELPGGRTCGQVLREYYSRRSVAALDPDLVIFDEFQNFGHIINLCGGAGEDPSALSGDMALLKSLCRQLYGGGQGPKTLALSATPLHAAVFDGEQESLRPLDMGRLRSFLAPGGAEEGADLYALGLFRNERRALLGERYGWDERRISVSPLGLLRQAAGIFAGGQGNRGDALVRTTPNARLYCQEGGSETVAYQGCWPRGGVSLPGREHPRYQALERLVCAPAAPAVSSGEALPPADVPALSGLLWLPPTRPGVLEGVFERYRAFSKSLIYSNLRATPEAVCALLNGALSPGKTALTGRNTLGDYLSRLLAAAGYRDVEPLTGLLMEYLLSRGGGLFGPEASGEAAIRLCQAGDLAGTLAEYARLNHPGGADCALANALRYGCHTFAAVLDARNLNEPDGGPTLRGAFNAPFWPFVVMTTSLGAEGLDFHLYCDRLVHYTAPVGVVEWEQKNGRIDRYDSLAVRRAQLSPDGSWPAEDCRGLHPHWDPGRTGLHYYYLQTRFTGEEEELDALFQSRRDYRASLGGEGSPVLSPICRSLDAAPGPVV